LPKKLLLPCFSELKTRIKPAQVLGLTGHSEKSPRKSICPFSKAFFIPACPNKAHTPIVWNGHLFSRTPAGLARVIDYAAGHFLVNAGFKARKSRAESPSH